MMTNDSPPTRATVTIILPAKNEGRAIGGTLRALPIATLTAMGLETEVVVLDGNSIDDTADIARRWGATVIPDREPGKGAAIRNARAGFRGDYMVMLDADGTYAPNAIPRLLEPLIRREADVVMAHRLLQPGSMPPLHLLGNVGLSFVASVFYWRICHDVCSGMWGFRREALVAIPLQSQSFGLEAELFALSARLGFRMARVRVDYLPRVGGPAKIRFGRDGLRIIRRLMRSRVVELPQPRPPDEGATAHVPGLPEARA